MTVKTPPPQQAPQARAPQAPLSAARAFVVQFREETAGNGFSGRVEHMITGHAARFESPEELLAFFAAVLSAAQQQGSQEG